MSDSDSARKEGNRQKIGPVQGNPVTTRTRWFSSPV